MSEEPDPRFQALGDVLQKDWPSDSAVAWVAGPWLLAEAQGMAGRPYREPQPISDRALAREHRRSNLASLMDRVIRGVEVDGVLFLPATQNQERVLGPVGARLGEPRLVPKARGRLRRASALGREAIDSWRALLEAMRNAGATAPWGTIGAVRTLLASARFLAFAEVTLDKLAPRALVLGSSHNGAGRAFTHVARERGIPTVYIPHAPALTESRINDLPFDRAGLRGEKEVELYRALGAATERIEVVGNPALPPREPPEINPGLPPVLAVSPVPVQALERLVEMAAEALGDEVILSPHPRSHLPQLRELAPSGWRISSGLTVDLLSQGPPVMIQRSSGVALEGLQLGIPVIQLALEGDRPGYPLIREPWVPVASSAAELAKAVAACRKVAADEARRAELIAYARGWCWPLGDEAIELSAAMVRDAAAEGAAPGPIWDAWKRAQR